MSSSDKRPSMLLLSTTSKLSASDGSERASPSSSMNGTLVSSAFRRARRSIASVRFMPTFLRLGLLRSISRNTRPVPTATSRTASPSWIAARVKPVRSDVARHRHQRFGVLFSPSHERTAESHDLVRGDRHCRRNTIPLAVHVYDLGKQFDERALRYVLRVGNVGQRAGCKLRENGPERLKHLTESCAIAFREANHGRLNRATAGRGHSCGEDATSTASTGSSTRNRAPSRCARCRRRPQSGGSRRRM